MFQQGEYVVSASKGVCLVEGTTVLDMPGADKNRSYYILKPTHAASSTVYVPLDLADSSLRAILNKEQADALLASVAEILPIEVENDKLLEQSYKNHLRTNDCADLLRIMKTIEVRKKKRLDEGRKMTALDMKYMRLAQDNLLGELSICLALPREKISEQITLGL